ncbi:hypothetical protein KIPB_009390, partial [Kipferlia bialata]
GITVDTLSTLLRAIHHNGVYGLKHITELNISGNRLNVQSTQLLTNMLPGLPLLTDLNVANCNLDVNLLLCNLAQVSENLQRLNIADNVYSTRCRDQFPRLGLLSNLLMLDMSGLQMDTRDISDLCSRALSGLRLLQTLYLGRNRIGDCGIEHIGKAMAKGAMPTLRRLQVESNNITHIGAKMLAAAALQWTHPLKELYIVKGNTLDSVMTRGEKALRKAVTKQRNVLAFETLK